MRNSLGNTLEHNKRMSEEATARTKQREGELRAREPDGCTDGRKGVDKTTQRIRAWIGRCVAKSEVCFSIWGHLEKQGSGQAQE